MNPWDFVDTGLFSDHRNTRRMVGKMATGKPDFDIAKDHPDLLNRVVKMMRKGATIFFFDQPPGVRGAHGRAEGEWD